jgi:hypothetical protein
MRWLYSKISGNHGSSWLKRILLLSLLFGALVTFNQSFADGPDMEHPWDDLQGTDSDKTTVINPPTGQQWVLLSLGTGPQFIIHVEPKAQKADAGKGKVSEPSVKNRVHLFIFIR